MNCERVVVQKITDRIIKTGFQGPTGPKGDKGDKGDQGDPGTPGSGGDKYFLQEFTSQSSQVVTHNLNKYPDISLFDSAGTEYDAEVVYDSLNQCTVSWNGSITGKIVCN